MAWLAPAATAGGSILGSVLGGKSQQKAAQSAADAQQNMLTTQLNYLQNAGSQARGAISDMLPYAQGAAQAASGTQAPTLTAGQGAVFGGQTALPTSNTADYSALLSPSANSGASPTQGQVHGMRAFLPQQALPGIGNGVLGPALRGKL